VNNLGILLAYKEKKRKKNRVLAFTITSRGINRSLRFMQSLEKSGYV